MSDARWVLSIDFGTTATAAAMSVGDGEEVVDIDSAPRMPSMVCWKESHNGAGGRLLIGEAAENEAMLSPQSVERCPKRKIAQEFMLLGGEKVRVTDVVGEIFDHVLAEAMPRKGGRRPKELCVTHPARWGDTRLAKLREAASRIGFEKPLLVPEPVGAAVYFATEQLKPDDHVVVYDLGGGTFDTALLRRTDSGFDVVGRAGGRDDLGGEDFDDRLYRFLGGQLNAEQWQALISPDSARTWQRAHFDFRKDVRRAKERLSKYPDATVRTPIPDDPDLEISVSDFEDLIRGDIETTVDELERTVTGAGGSVADLSAIYLAGGSSRIPLVSRRIEERLGLKPSMLGDPKAVIALGATRVHSRTGSVPPGSFGTPRTDKGKVKTKPPASKAPRRPTPEPSPELVGLAAIAGAAAKSPPKPTPKPAPTRASSLADAARATARTAPSGKAQSKAGQTAQTEASQTAQTDASQKAATASGATAETAASPEPKTTPTPKRQTAPAVATAGVTFGALIAAAGGAMLIASPFLPWIADLSAWSGINDLPKRYSLILIALGAEIVVLAGLGARFSRGAALRWASYFAAFATGVTFPLTMPDYRNLQLGFWLAIGGSAIATLGAVIAVQALRMKHQRGTRARRLPVIVSLIAVVGLAAVPIGSLLPTVGTTNLWNLNVVTRYPLVTTLLAGVLIALVIIDAAGHRATALGLVAVASSFLVGALFPLMQRTYTDFRYGFWIAVLGALVAVMATGGSALARTVASEHRQAE